MATSIEDLRVVKAVVPLTGRRGTIAKRMTNSILTAPQGTQFLDVDMTESLALRNRLNDGFKATHGFSLSVTAIIIRAVVKALQDNPLLNSVIEDNQVKLIDNVNIGVAVALDDGLAVPVIHNAHEKSLADIALELNELSRKARAKRLSAFEMSGGTFSITNLGMYGIGHFTPLINTPESAILGVGGIEERTVVRNGEIVIRPMMGLGLTMDHRAVDGVPAAIFFSRIRELLQTSSGNER
jgi:pyruvate dehydrogenase E2 component (dihydrolipoyllysine-residue acetyltransferase)